MKRTRIGALLIGAGLLVAACTGGSASPTAGEPTTAPEPGATAAPTEEAGTPKDGGTLVVALDGDISFTDPALNSDSNSSYVINQVMEGLVGLTPGTTGEVIPVLASALPTISSDGLTYTFPIREGVTFHDGTPLDCDAVKFNYDRWLNLPDEYSKLEYTYYIDFALRPVVASVACNSPTEFAITLKQPNSPFLLTQTLTPFYIASPKALTEGDASNPDVTKNTYAQGGLGAMIGTGPFKFKSWTKGDSITLEKNADYWDATHAAHLDGIVFKVIKDSTATLNALQEGGIDFAQTLAPIDAATAAEDSNLQAIDRGSSCNLFNLGLNQKHKPFDNLKIRQAVAYAIDKQALIDTFYGGDEGAVAADNWMPPGTVAYKALNLPTYDPEKAKALIAESGLSAADLTFDFWYPSNTKRPYMPDPQGEFEAIRKNLEDVGFTINPQTSDWSTVYIPAESGGKYPMWLIGWTCDWQGPDNFLNGAWFGYRTRSDKTIGPNEEYEYKNDTMWQAMSNALTTTDSAQAMTLWQEVQDYLAQDMPSVPLLSSKPPAAAAAYVKGFVPAGNLTELFNSVWLDK